MLVTLGISNLEGLTSALAANEVLLLEVFHASTLLFTSKVWILAFEAHKIV